MPELNPSWEYYEPDPEIAEIMGDGIDGHTKEVYSYSELLDDRAYKSNALGMRFGRIREGKGCPDRAVLREAKEKISNSRRLERKICKQCGYSFQPKSRRRKYCSHKCSSLSQIGKYRRVVITRKCVVCSKEYILSSNCHSDRKACSHSCASKLRGNKLSGLDRFKDLYETGIKVTDIATELNISPVTAKKWRRRLGIAARGPRGMVIGVA